jgi:uncharacterized membrane protein YdjX (TVP38/TMEM64 family)
MVMCTSVYIGGFMAFLISRYLVHSYVRNNFLKKHKKFMVLNKIMKEKGWKIVLLFRLTPFPYSLASYIFGVTEVKMKDYLIGSLGIFCFTSIYCYTGVSLRNLQH